MDSGEGFRDVSRAGSDREVRTWRCAASFDAASRGGTKARRRQRLSDGLHAVRQDDFIRVQLRGRVGATPPESKQAKQQASTKSTQGDEEARRSIRRVWK